MSELSQEQKNDNLLWAVRERRPAEIKRMIAAGAQLECVDGNWNSPLYTAAAMGRIEEAEILLAAGAKPDWAHRNGTPALFVAVGASPSLTQLLLRHGANPNVANDLGETPLFSAIRKFGVVSWVRSACVIHLIEAGADVNVCNAVTLKTPLHCCADMSATEHGEAVEIAELLLKAGAEVNAERDIGLTPLADAIVSGNARLFDRLLREPNSQRSLDAALTAAVEMGREPQWLRQLIDLGADVTQRVKNQTLIQRVPRQGEHVEANKRLLRSARTQRTIESALSDGPEPSTPGSSGGPKFGVL